jgi:hypothetical protein
MRSIIGEEEEDSRKILRKFLVFGAGSKGRGSRIKILLIQKYVL